MRGSTKKILKKFFTEQILYVLWDLVSKQVRLQTRSDFFENRERLFFWIYSVLRCETKKPDTGHPLQLSLSLTQTISLGIQSQVAGITYPSPNQATCWTYYERISDQMQVPRECVGFYVRDISWMRIFFFAENQFWSALAYTHT